MFEIQLQIERSIVQQVGFGSFLKEIEVSHLAATETVRYPHNVCLLAVLKRATKRVVRHPFNKFADFGGSSLQVFVQLPYYATGCF